MDWKNLPEEKRRAAAAKGKAWKDFLNRFPKADKSKFVAEPHFDDKLNAAAEVFVLYLSRVCHGQTNFIPA